MRITQIIETKGLFFPKRSSCARLKILLQNVVIKWAGGVHDSRNFFEFFS